MSIAPEELSKLAEENKLFDMDFSNALSSGETVLTINNVTASSAGLVAGSTLINILSQTISNNIVQVRISGGTKYEQYTVKISVTTSNNNTLVGIGMLRVE